MKNSGNLLQDRHKNFENRFRNSWDNWGQNWQPSFRNGLFAIIHRGRKIFSMLNVATLTCCETPCTISIWRQGEHYLCSQVCDCLVLVLSLWQFLMEFLIKTVCWSDPEMRAAAEPGQGEGYYININISASRLVTSTLSIQWLFITLFDWAFCLFAEKKRTINTEQAGWAGENNIKNLFTRIFGVTPHPGAGGWNKDGTRYVWPG